MIDTQIMKVQPSFSLCVKIISGNIVGFLSQIYQCLSTQRSPSVEARQVVYRELKVISGRHDMLIHTKRLETTSSVLNTQLNSLPGKKLATMFRFLYTHKKIA